MLLGTKRIKPEHHVPLTAFLLTISNRYFASLDDSPYSKWLTKLWMYIGQEGLLLFVQEQKLKHMYFGVSSEVDLSTQEGYDTSMLTRVDSLSF